MSKDQLGSKRVCGKCQVKFYDLNKSLPSCPKCGSAPVAPSADRGAAEMNETLDREEEETLIESKDVNLDDKVIFRHDDVDTLEDDGRICEIVGGANPDDEEG